MPVNDAPEHRFSAMARPLDPSWRSNLAVLVLMPVAGLVALLWAMRSGVSGATPLLVAGAVGGGVVLGTWALGRELAPDDQAAAFVAVALGFAAHLLVDEASLILVFVALSLARVVNRTVGPSPTIFDRIGVLGLTGISAWRLAAPELWLAAALAFALDARHSRHGTTSWVSSATAVAFMGLQILLATPDAPSMDPLGGDPVAAALAGVTAIAFVAVISRTRTIRSAADMTGEPLSPARVRSGMVVVTALALRSFLAPPPAMAQTALVWAAMAGVALSSLVGRRDDTPT